ncbi:hemerythrin-like domain-containing protein [Azospirillum agricola]|uniref:hemerythrin domain-containing protein n=1 Tax=Azospirillum agricola TaxID=1720247 RepID=UPI001AE17C10|nr:hemerythrin domain-containing protein [Azospirillum agricola]MBP2229990.1 hemerythrin-like domain-containing protein [Azospirillum agricola]
MDMTSFNDHHAEVLALAASVERRLDPAAVAADPAAVSGELVRLFGKFSVHLAIEDKALYPRLARGADPALRSMAVRFQEEMGGLTQRFDTYRKAWPGPLAIARDPARFIAETRAILAQLKARIGREDAELYPLAARAAA